MWSIKTIKATAATGDDRTFAYLIQVFTDTAGATAIEYGLIAALIAIAAVSAMAAVGSNLSGTFNTIATAL